LRDAQGNKRLVLNLDAHRLFPHGDGDLVQERQDEQADGQTPMVIMVSGIVGQ